MIKGIRGIVALVTVAAVLGFGFFSADTLSMPSEAASINAASTYAGKSNSASANTYETSSDSDTVGSIYSVLSEAEPQSKLRYHVGSKNVTSKSCIVPQYKAKNNIFGSSADGFTWKFYNLRSFGFAGIGLNSSEQKNYGSSYENSANVAYTEMYFGIYAEIKNGILTVVPYSHLSGVTCTNISVVFEIDSVQPKYTLSEKSLTADLYDISYPNGLYAINGKFKYNSKEYICNLYMYVNCLSDNKDDYDFYICCASSLEPVDRESPETRIVKLEKMINKAGVTPESSLETNIAYPQEAFNADYYDTQYWVNKSDEIVKNNKNSSKAYKATLIHDWITENLVYDYYKVNVLGKPRYDGDFVSGKNYVSAINVGVCRDFAYIYMIMCRQQGIPCIMYSTEDHMWNAIYVNGEWIEIDVTMDVQRTTSKADMSDIPPKSSYNTHCYSGYCNYRKHTTYPEGVNKTLMLY